MNVGVAIFVKTPGLSPVKTRLAKSVGKVEAENFFNFSVQAVKTTVEEFMDAVTCDVVPYWATAEDVALSADYWPDFNVIDTGEGGLGERLAYVYSQLKKKHDVVFLVGADSPQIRVGHFVKSLQAIESGANYIVGPANDGGFYLFSSNQHIEPSFWTDVPYSVECTLEMLLQKIKGQGHFGMLEILSDVDELEDLMQLMREFVEPVNGPQQKIISWFNSQRKLII